MRGGPKLLNQTSHFLVCRSEGAIREDDQQAASGEHDLDYMAD